jgi:hypothetical protein
MAARDILLRFRAAKSTHAIDDEAYYQNQTNAAAAYSRTAQVKPAPAEHQKKNKQNKY